MGHTFDKANANVPSTHTTQYFEMLGNPAIYHDGWMASTTPPQPPWLAAHAKMPDVVNGYKWELYNVTTDYSQANDLAATMPDKLREMQELFLVEEAKYHVFPLDNDFLNRVLAPKPSYTGPPRSCRTWRWEGQEPLTPGKHTLGGCSARRHWAADPAWPRAAPAP